MIRVIEHRVRALAVEIHAVQMVAYAQEAALLGVTFFPPLEEAPEDIMQADATYLGVMVGDALAGALSIEAPDGAQGERLIGSLVVSPAYQRQGIGARLVEEALARCRPYGVRVSTGVRNAPALALYQRYGFVPYQRLVMGEREPVEVVRLRWREPP